MPLQKLQLRPGVNRESTTLANEGTWFEMDKVRFRSGYPEKLGGWVLDTGTTPSELQPPAGSYWGVARSLWNWVTLAGSNLMGIGTNLKYYIQQSSGGDFYDITPIRTVNTVAANAFTTVNGSTTVVVNDALYGGQEGDFVTISGVVGAVNGIPAAALNREFRITYLTTTTYSITVASPATSSGTTGAATFSYQISVGGEVFTVGTGWGAGGWGGNTAGTLTGWGEAAPAGLGVGQQLRLWSQDNYGEDLILNPRGGGLYLWKVNVNPNIYDRAVLLASTSPSPYTTDTDCPSVANAVAISDASRFVIAFGCNDYGSAVLDPLLVRWSDQEDYALWSPAITNQAGSYRLSTGSSIVAHQQTRQEILVWTDAAMYSMQYLGPPYVWGFQILGENTSIAGPNATATAANIVYWMGSDKFYMYSGRVETLYCPLRQYVFGDINLDQQYQFIAGTNEGYNEIWWFYCSANSTVIDRYVVFNHLEKIWSYGNLARTAWLDTPLREYPSAAGYNGQLIYHENGVDDGTTNPPSPIVSFCQSADFNIGDGHNYGFAWRMILRAYGQGMVTPLHALPLCLYPTIPIESVGYGGPGQARAGWCYVVTSKGGVGPSEGAFWCGAFVNKILFFKKPCYNILGPPDRARLAPASHSCRPGVFSCVKRICVLSCSHDLPLDPARPQKRQGDASAVRRDLPCVKEGLTRRQPSPCGQHPAERLQQAYPV